MSGNIFMAADTRSEYGRRNSGGVPAEQQEMIRLLCRALTRLAVAAQGIDARLDHLLGELRQILRRELDEPAQLAGIVDAIDARIKHVDDERDRHIEVFQRELDQLTAQLLAVRPPAAVAAALREFQKKLKKGLADGEDITLLNGLAALQSQVLAADSAPRQGLLARLFGGPGATADGAPGPADLAPASAPPSADAPTSAPAEIHPATAPVSVAAEPVAAAVVQEAPPTEENRDTLELDSNVVAVGGSSLPASMLDEPAFARISSAICQVLEELLRQIEPPPQVRDSYQHAATQIAKGLNWYELVSTLEEVSVVVLAALERGQGELQQFLLGLSQRLAEADQTLQASRQRHAERRQDDDRLNESVRMEVAEMQTQVAEATELEQLKAEVSVRLEAVVGAMDQHKQSENVRQRELEQQLNTLTERMRDMEAQSLLIEARMVEQRRLALLDTLTQLPNRQAYDESLQQEYQRWLRFRRPLTLAVCDIDNFKSINDNYGHLAGDKVLRIIARTLRNRLRKTDFIARFGGEEFVVLMPETDAADALQTLDAIRLAVASCPFHFREQPVTITISAGIAAFNDGALGPDAVFERADAALYRAKQAGRNCCMLDNHATASVA